MGSDFLKKTKPSYEKYIDNNRVDLETPDLLTRTPETQPRRALAAVSSGVTLNRGDAVIIETQGGRLVARHGNTVVANFKKPPRDIVAAIAGSGGLASGVVEQVNKLSRTVEVSIC